MDSQTPIADSVSVKSASPTDTASSAGTKRKRTPEPKFYAVRVGHQPGLYNSWPECLAQVKGFRHADYAESFLAGRNPFIDPSSRSFQSQKFYAVQSGRVPGVYTDWPSAQKQITGWKAPKHKSFVSRAEAEKFVRVGGSNGQNGQNGGASGNGIVPEHSVAGKANTLETSNVPMSKVPTSKKVKKSNPTDINGSSSTTIADEVAEPTEPGTGPLPSGAIDGFDPRIVLDPESGEVVFKSDEQKALVKLKSKGEKPTGMLRIYTDGSSLGNGALGAKAGVGVYFGPDDARNISEPLPGPRQTNQRAELTAVSRALDIAPRHRDVAIFTDSKYAIDCVTVWFINWRRNKWITAAGKPVENKDLVEGILSKIEERNALKVQTKFQWIKGHANDPGNVAADTLAASGARESMKGG
ncbi:MAG: hypothetical protein M1835_004475 [Candelina submexicana]|nr:MAG: hypothetical protein M1835_004475 [Candelina submexicana]